MRKEKPLLKENEGVEDEEDEEEMIEEGEYEGNNEVKDRAIVDTKEDMTAKEKKDGVVVTEVEAPNSG